MGANNYLIGRDSDHGICIYFKYGDVREIYYNINEKIKWYDVPRPADADGTVYVAGYSFDKLDDLNFKHYKISVISDVISGYEEISEDEFEDLEDLNFEMLHPTGKAR